MDRALDRTARCIVEDRALPPMQRWGLRDLDGIIEIVAHELRDDYRWRFPEVRERVGEMIGVRL
jgi:hypothetical protein